LSQLVGDLENAGVSSDAIAAEFVAVAHPLLERCNLLRRSRLIRRC